ncbi:MAG: hypothetical protein A2161_00420 [Candidatus Schekmanbacteria bacterium RBG_13_48_7]|uniref:Glycosyltransferase RgtA/B/C/D-like domain-containing protein n=1 Tax=Candidatus Schekmanbacteria bacterium RBG_13_48_7 TaxID=1817878 RepID=A0A1F7S9F2_9BACT|nr:MAG: hypothetical protein A2161_00420 [Candidatus Schekmanbacteria bacterium RBG_13_48_7]
MIKKINLFDTHYILTAIIVFTVIVYIGIFNNVPYNDDFSWMRNCFKENTCHSIPGFIVDTFNFTKDQHFYRPVAEILFTGFSSVFGKTAFLYHFVSLLLHIINGILVFNVLKKIFQNRETALLGTLLFLIHPATNETTYWISGIITLVFTLFYLAALNIFLDAIENNKLSSKTMMSVVFLIILALLTKEAAITFLPIFILAYIFFKKNKSLRIWYLFAVFIGVVAGYLMIQYSVETKNYLVVEKIYKPGLHFFKNILVFHFVLLFPKEINGVYSKSWDFLFPVFLLSIIGIIVGNKKTKFMVLWYWVTLLPASFFEYQSYITSRYLYVTSIGFCGILAQFFVYLWHKFRYSKSILVVISFGLLFLVFFYSYKSFFNDLYFEAKPVRDKVIYETVKSRYPVIPDHTRLFLFNFPSLEVHLNAMMKVWDNPFADVYTSFDLRKMEPGSIILVDLPDKIYDLTHKFNRDNREIIFGEETTMLFLKRGWTRNVTDTENNVNFNWIKALEAVSRAPVWERNWYELTLKIKYVPKFQYQIGNLIIRMNDQIIYTLELAPGWHEYNVRISKYSVRDGDNEISFIIGKQLKNEPEKLGIPIAHPGDIGLAYLKFTPVKPTLEESRLSIKKEKPRPLLPK